MPSSKAIQPIQDNAKNHCDTPSTLSLRTPAETWKGSVGLIPLALILSLTLGCSKKEETKPAATKTPTTVAAAQTPTPSTTAAPTAAQAPSTPTAPPHPPIAAPSPADKAAPASPPQASSAPEPPLNIPQSGKVIGSKQAGAYTYVQVEAEGTQYWVATNQFEPKVGEIVHWNQYSVMKNFYSKTLQETFPMVLFVGAVLPGPVPAPGTPPAQAATQADTPSKGKVHAVEQAGGYTYLQINNETGLWLAVPTSSVKEGDTVVWEKGTLMKNFSSKSLNRTFDEILFLGGIKVE
ncbi:MAG: hypothetical protein H7839_21400 [Magnetococcus sp. YQC-5]